MGKSVFLLSIANLLIEDGRAMVLYLPEGVCVPFTYMLAITGIVGRYPYRPVSVDLMKILSPPFAEDVPIWYDQPELSQHLLKSLLVLNQKHLSVHSEFAKTVTGSFCSFLRRTFVPLSIWRNCPY